jgi:hypothetical protein
MRNNFIIVCTGSKPNILLFYGKKINYRRLRTGVFGTKKDKLVIKTKIVFHFSEYAYTHSKMHKI